MRMLVMAMLMMVAAPAAAQRINANEIAAIAGIETVQGRSPAWIYQQHVKLTKAIAALKPQNPGTPDAYVVSVGLDGDPVFGREAAEASRVLARRYNAAGRTILLAAGGGAGADAVANGMPSNLAIALGGVADAMDKSEDVLVLFLTTHGGPKIGLSYKDGDSGIGLIAPARLKEMLDGFGFKRRLIIISACFSGEFVPPLASDDSVIVTAASAVTTSFGCEPGNDWTFFGDAFINTGLREPVPIEQAVSRAFGLITEWEYMRGVPPSNPQFFIGARARDWLDPLEAASPKVASAKVGRPAIAR